MPDASIIRQVADRYRFDGVVVERISLIPIAVTALFTAIVVGGVGFGVVSYRGDELNGVGAALAVLWLCGIACQAIGLRSAGEALKILALAAVTSVAASLASAVLARISLPLADDLFVGLDEALFAGFDWRATIQKLDRLRLLTAALSYAYVSLNWQPTLLFVYFCVTGRSRRAWQVLAAMAVSLVLCVAIFPFCPAVGGYVHFGIGHDDVPNVLVASAWRYPETLAGLRDGRLDYLGLKTMEGIIAMPSFHAASAVILAWGFLGSWLLRWPFLVLNLVMLVSAVPIGGHYLVDVVAGCATASLAILAIVCRRPCSAGGVAPLARAAA